MKEKSESSRVQKADDLYNDVLLFIRINLDRTLFSWITLI
jgi:hypothetical protein